MFSELDERQGVVKADWGRVREKLGVFDPYLVKLVDDISPGKSCPLYLAYYKYGDVICDTESPFLPTQDGGLCRLMSPETSCQLRDDLGYGCHSAPLSMVVEKNFEWFIDTDSIPFFVPWRIYGPGSFFPVSQIMRPKSGRKYSSNGLFTASSGARSSFMLPSIGCAVNHVNLQREFGIKESPPKSLTAHWGVFKKIVNHPRSECSWRSCLLLFPERWVRCLAEDTAWEKLRFYMQSKSWERFEHERNQVYFDLAFSCIMNKRNLKPNPYLVDTAKHLFAIALGNGVGYRVAVSEDLLPLQSLREAFVDSYGLKKYLPHIMQPSKFVFESDVDPIYYSMQFPTGYSFSPKSRRLASTLSEMRELAHIMDIFSEELQKTDFVCSDAVLHTVAKAVEFGYFHNDVDPHGVIGRSSAIFDMDARFDVGMSNFQGVGAKDGKFFRGCVQIAA